MRTTEDSAKTVSFETPHTAFTNLGHRMCQSSASVTSSSAGSNTTSLRGSPCEATHTASVVDAALSRDGMYMYEGAVSSLVDLLLNLHSLQQRFCFSGGLSYCPGPCGKSHQWPSVIGVSETLTHLYMQREDADYERGWWLVS